ncbi:MAG: hypothetical protein FWE88_03130 [Phycisphaerae bacterium]|nr:hypothetical protein [Phycisphaerae bacterium]
MARVVQRRSTPPYLLIVFVFLFLIATVVAVLMYLKSDELTAQLAAEKDKTKAVGTTEELNAARALASGAPKGTSYLKAYQDELRKLAQLVDSRATAADAYGRVENLDVAEPFTKNKGVLPLVDDLKEALTAKDVTIRELTGKFDLARENQAKAEQALEAVSDMVKELQAQSEAGTAKVVADIANLKEADAAERQEIRRELEKKQADIMNQVVQLEAEKRGLHRRIADLERDKQEIVDAKREAAAQMRVSENIASSMTNQPAGKIMKVYDDTVYINLGKNDKVLPTMTFSIYPAGPVTDENKLKGTLEILQVSDTTSECRITNRYASSGTITAGDIIGNITFVRNRTFVFVVKGGFDMSGSGRATAEGASAIRDMVVRNGGKLMDNVTIATDILVIGAEPPTPPRPGDDATEAEIDIFTQQMQVVREYNKAIEEADKYKIPILNANRFMALIGHQPGSVELPRLVQGN